MFEGFSPVFDCDSKILILGSFPSVKSRDVSFYYGNPQNRFWKTLALIYGENVYERVEDKKAFLLRRNIALWDIVKKCKIDGSLDSNLKCIEVVNLNEIFEQAKIEKILCNGSKSYQLFCNHYPQFKDIAVRLPSTSPANIRFDGEKWRDELLRY